MDREGNAYDMVNIGDGRQRLPTTVVYVFSDRVRCMKPWPWHIWRQG